MGKSSINGPFSMAMLKNQRVNSTANCHGQKMILYMFLVIHPRRILGHKPLGMDYLPSPKMETQSNS